MKTHQSTSFSNILLLGEVALIMASKNLNGQIYFFYFQNFSFFLFFCLKSEDIHTTLKKKEKNQKNIFKGDHIVPTLY